MDPVTVIASDILIVLSLFSVFDMLRLNFIIIFLRPYSDLVPMPGHGAQVLKWTLFTHACARTKNVH